jgi:hypothetical protein
MRHHQCAITPTKANIIIGVQNIRVVIKGRSAVGAMIINCDKDYFDHITIKGRKINIID